MSKKIGIFSFFAGAGFLDLGFEHTDHFETLFVNEYHKPFMDVYKHSREKLKIAVPTYEHHTDSITEYLSNLRITKLKEQVDEARRKKDLIGFIGGPPCPDFSVGGKNRGEEGENGRLSGTYVELITKVQPDFFLFENVKGLYRTQKHRIFFELLKQKLVKAGYRLTERLINALEYGAPQDRERIILIGFKKNTLLERDFKVNGSPYLNNFNWLNNTLYDLKDLQQKSWPDQDPFYAEGERPMPEGVVQELTVEHWFRQNNVAEHDNSDKFFKPKAGLSKFQAIPEGDDLKKSFKRLHRWRYSPTAAYGNNEVHLHPYKARRLSAAEALAVQSLPNDFILPDNITLTDMFKTIGNGVPYLAAKGLAQTIYDYIYNNPIKETKVNYAEALSR